MAAKRVNKQDIMIQKIDSLKEHFNFRIDDLKEDIQDMKPEIKSNTEFRLKAKGIIGAISVICTLIGGLTVTIGTKVISIFRGGN